MCARREQQHHGHPLARSLSSSPNNHHRSRQIAFVAGGGARGGDPGTQINAAHRLIRLALPFASRPCRAFCSSRAAHSLQRWRPHLSGIALFLDAASRRPCPSGCMRADTLFSRSLVREPTIGNLESNPAIANTVPTSSFLHTRRPVEQSCLVAYPRRAERGDTRKASAQALRCPHPRGVRSPPLELARLPRRICSFDHLSWR